MSWIKRLLQGIYHKDQVITKPDNVSDLLSDDAKSMLHNFMATASSLRELLNKEMLVSSERFGLYREYDNMLQSPLVSSALEFYSETASQYDKIHNATVWVTSENPKIRDSVEKLLDRINVEELIYDWTFTVGLYGDLFVKVVGQPGVGVISVFDSEHPIVIGRVDMNGRLLGFYDTVYGQQDKTDESVVMPAWSYVHFRMLGVKKRRCVYGEEGLASQPISVVWLGDRKRRLTSKYGSSILVNAIGAYKRLRLVEESLMLSRLSKGILRYIYKVKVDSGSIDAIGSLMDEYKMVLKRARAINVTRGSERLNDMHSEMSVIEDVILPVWGDTNNLEIEKIGGEGDIKWIADHEEYRNQLAVALRVPFPVLGGYTNEMPQGLGNSSLERYDIRFVRSAVRLQRAIITGIKQLALIHLAYQGLSVKPEDFEIEMATLSSAEDEEQKQILDTASDVVNKVSDIIISHLGDDIDKVALLDYLNKKVLKLTDLDLDVLVNADKKIKDCVDKRPSLKKYLTETINECKQMVRAGNIREKKIVTPDMDAKLLPYKSNIEEWNKEKLGKFKVVLSETKE